MANLRIMPALFALVLSLTGLATTARADDMPVITSHSQTEFAVYRGDRVTVDVQATGKDLTAEWFRGRDLVCHALTCEIDTGTWGLGVHALTFVLYNAKGSLSLRFHIRLLVSPTGYRPGRVHPPMVGDTAGIESVRNDDLTVRMLAGRGFSYHKKKLQVIGPLPRVLDWSETLRTQAEALMRFGREKGETQLLAASSSVTLRAADSGRRALVLRRGTLRSRVLGNEAPRWSILAGWVQVDTDAQGDVLVTAEPEDKGAPADDEATDGSGDGDGDAKPAGAKSRIGRVVVTVLRGNARVFLHRRGDDGEVQKVGDPGEAVLVRQGLSLVLERDDTDTPRPVLPQPKKVASLVAATTPEYLPGQKSESVLLGAKAPKTATNAVTLARDANDHRDYFVAIEALAPFADTLAKDYDANLVLGEAYAGVFLVDAAVSRLKAAAELRDEAPEPHMDLAKLAMAGREWKKALPELDAAAERGYADGQVVDYYSGVAAYNRKDKLAARAAFTRAVWAGGNPELTASAKAFLAKLDAADWFTVRFALGVLYDSNVLRSDSLDPASVGLKTKKSAGVEASGGFALSFSRSGPVTAGVRFDALQRQYLAASLAALTYVDEGLAFDLGLGFGGTDGARTVTVDLELLAKTLGVGGQRAADEIGGRVAVGVPAFLGMRLGVESLKVKDPQPGRDFILDPVLLEVVEPSDRSVQLLTIDLGLVPYERDAWRVAMDVRDGSGTYAADATDSTFKDLGLGAEVGYKASTRSRYGFALRENQRKFPQASDGRKDTTLSLGPGWGYQFSPALSQDLGLVYESQTSSRADNKYKREVLSYRLGLTF